MPPSPYDQGLPGSLQGTSMMDHLLPVSDGDLEFQSGISQPSLQINRRRRPEFHHPEISAQVGVPPKLGSPVSQAWRDFFIELGVLPEVTGSGSSSQSHSLSPSLSSSPSISHSPSSVESASASNSVTVSPSISISPSLSVSGSMSFQPPSVSGSVSISPSLSISTSHSASEPMFSTSPSVDP